MKYSKLVLVGIILLSLGVGPTTLSASDGHKPYLSDPVTSCTDPIERPVMGSTDSPEFIGTIARFQENRSLVKVSYNATRNRSDQTFSVSLHKNSSIVEYSEGLRKTTNYSVEATQAKSQYWVVFDPGVALRESEYPSSNNWLFAPTPEHGPAVALKTENRGYIGYNYLFLGEYETIKHRTGCQKFVVIKPTGEDFNAERKLRVVASAARLLDFGHHYSTVRIFASPHMEDDLRGYVHGYYNEILLDGTTSVQHPDNIWVHEYVHTLQNEHGANMVWSNEGAATYYAARVSLELGLISELEYDKWLTDQSKYEPEKTLAEANKERVSYKWGSLIFAETAARSYRSRPHQSLEYQYNELQTYGMDGYGDFDTALRDLNLSQKYRNQTRATVMNGDKPPLKYAYQSQLGKHAGWYLMIRGLLASAGAWGFLFGISMCLYKHN